MALTKPSKTWLKYLNIKYEELVNCDPVPFKRLSSSDIPNKPGVYLITARKYTREICYYVGRTKKLRNRHKQHLSSNFGSARLQKYLVDTKECSNPATAKEFIVKYCRVRWVEESNMRKRYALEGYLTGMLFPQHGISEEH